jgi:hypothetical protein
MDPALQRLIAYDTNHCIDALAASLQETWKLEYLREQALSLIWPCIQHNPPNAVATTMTAEALSRTIFRCMLTPIQFLAPQHAEMEAHRILHNMHVLLTNLEPLHCAALEEAATRQRENREARLLFEATRKYKMARKRAEKKAAAAQTLAGMDFPWWPPEEPWDSC